MTTDDVRTMLHRHADEATVSPDAWEEIERRLDIPARRRSLRPLASVAVAAALLVAAVLAWPDTDHRTKVVTPATTAPARPLPPHIWTGEPGRSPAEIGTSYIEGRLGRHSMAVSVRPAGENEAVGRYLNHAAVTELFFRKVDNRWLLISSGSDLVPIIDARHEGDIVIAHIRAEAAGTLTITGRSPVEVSAGQTVEVHDAIDGPLRATLRTSDGSIALSEVVPKADPAFPTSEVVSAWPATDEAGLDELQHQAETGDRPDLLDPRAVAGGLLGEVFGKETPFSTEPFRQGDPTSGEVPYSTDGTDGLVLVRQHTPSGIWYVTSVTSSGIGVRGLARQTGTFSVDVGQLGRWLDAEVRTTGGGVERGRVELVEHQSEAEVSVPSIAGARWVRLTLLDQDRVHALAIVPLP